MYKEYTQEELTRLHRIMLDMLRDFDRICRKHKIRYFAIDGTALGAVRHKGYIPWDDDIDIAMLRPDYNRLLSVYKEEFGDRYTLFSPEAENKYYNFVPILSKNNTRMIVPLSKDVFDTGIFIDIFLYENIPDDRALADRYIDKCYFWRNIYVMGRANFELLYPGATAGQKIKYTIAGVVRKIMSRVDPDGNKVRRMYMKQIMKYAGKTKTYTVLGDPYAKDVIMRRDEFFPIVRLPFEDFDMPVMNQYLENLRRKYGEDYMQLPPKEKRINHCPYILEFDVKQPSDTGAGGR